MQILFMLLCSVSKNVTTVPYFFKLFVPNFTFLYSSKASEKCKVFYFQEVRKCNIRKK